MGLMSIPVTKGKTALEIETDNLPQEVYEEALRLGLKDLLNRGMSKVTKAELPDEAELKAKALEIAEVNRAKILAGEIRFSSGKTKSAISGTVKTEAMRLARNVVKDELKKAGYKISHIDASEITAAAKELLEADPSLIELAKKNLDERQAVPVAGKINLAGIKINEKKVKADADKKAAKVLSAKQAGIPLKTKGKGKGAPASA